MSDHLTPRKILVSTYTDCTRVPEVIKRRRIDLLSEHISYSCVGENIRVKQSQTQSQQPKTQRNAIPIKNIYFTLKTVTVKTHKRICRHQTTGTVRKFSIQIT